MKINCINYNNPPRFKTFFKNYLSNALGLSQLPNRSIAQNSDGLYVGTPRPIADFYPNMDGIDSNSANAGDFETLSIQFMNEAVIAAATNNNKLPLYHFDRLIVTVSVNPTATPSAARETAIAQRFNEIEKRLVKLSTSQVPFLDQNSASTFYPNLPFPISFVVGTTDRPSVQRIDYVTGYGNSNTRGTTQCASKTTANIIGTCPLPTKILLLTQFWSQCPAEPQSPAASQQLSPICLDYFGEQVNVSAESKPTWCQQGWFNYPLVTTVQSCPAKVNYSTPTPSNTEGGYINWVPPVNPAVINDVVNTVTITWSWPSSTNFNPTLTLDVLYYTSPSSYSQVLTTVLATQLSVSVKIPQNTTQKIFDKAFIRLRCTQFAKYQTLPTVSFPLTVNNVDKCAASTCSSILNNTCNPTTGNCECITGYNRMTVGSLECTLPCTGHCLEEKYCHPLNPNVCERCPEGTLPPLCATPVDCGNDSTTGLNKSCNNHGFIDKSVNGGECNTTQCTCVAHQYWSGDKCNLCLLIDADPNQPEHPKCVPEHTDLDKTRRDVSNNSGLECGSCACLPGYSGEYCEIGFLRGDVIYQLDGEPQIPSDDDDNNDVLFSIQQFNPNQTEDPNGLHFVTEEGRIVLERDMALSLGLDTGSVSISKITQIVTTTPQPDSGTMIIAQTKTTTTTVTYTTTPTSGQTSLADLTGAWGDMQKEYANLPVGNSEASNQIGSANSVGNAQQPDVKPVEPECDPATQNCDCTPEEKLANGGTSTKRTKQ